MDNTAERSLDDFAEGFPDQLEDSLPRDEREWEQSALGPPGTWPETLKACSKIVMSSTYPACVFWGEEMALLHNCDWTKATGVQDQGQKQCGKLSAGALDALSALLHGGVCRKVDSRAFFRRRSADKAARYTVLLSPLFDDANLSKGCADGSLVQLIPKPDFYFRAEEDNQPLPSYDGEPKSLGKGFEPGINMEQLGKALDDILFDDHPFFPRFAEMLPIGLAILDHKAQAVFTNDCFSQLTTHRGENQDFKSWPQSIHPDDYERVMEAYHDAVISQKQLRTEFRALGEQRPWRLLFLTPLGEDDIQHVSLREYGGFICSVVDITCEKSAELAEREAAKDACERREQQERFIDMISHEMRNPLSAMLHCLEDIDEAVSEPNREADVPSIKEAVETINVCIQHQRNIVDDVLSFSKLDTSIVSLSPKACLPDRQIANSLKLFQPEFRRQGMQFVYKVDQSYIDFGLSWVMADMARISQVLINLVSNAIKFTTKGQGDKKVVVSVGASAQRPTSYPPNVVFFNSESHVDRKDATNTHDWGSGEAVYIMVAVKDTGIGISDEGQQRLFERFMATPKTVDTYGGSGLGLNISRKLCHVHGGEVGVSSEIGCGSTFSFFFKVKRSEQPQDYESQAEGQVGNASLRCQLEQPGNAASKERDEGLFPESLKHPPIEDTGAMAALSNDKQDDRHQRTSKIAQNLRQERIVYEKSKDYILTHNERKGSQHLTGDPISSGQAEDYDGHSNQTNSSGAPVTRRTVRVHILLVEDNTINQKVVFRKLESKGYKVTTANNGREAVESVKSAPKPSIDGKPAFDICLMDMEMPIMDGNTATRAIRELERQGKIEHIPILGVTANVRGEQQTEMKMAGMDDVISKPYRIEEMVKKIHKIIGSVEN